MYLEYHNLQATQGIQHRRRNNNDVIEPPKIEAQKLERLKRIHPGSRRYYFGRSRKRKAESRINFDLKVHNSSLQKAEVFVKFGKIPTLGLYLKVQRTRNLILCFSLDLLFFAVQSKLPLRI